MRALLQRVNEASVTIDGRVNGHIAQGVVVFVGFTTTDTLEVIEAMAKKIAHLRIFDDAAGVMNESLIDQGHSILSISQFTLYADTTKGHRPSYVNAAPRDQAIHWYALFNQALAQYAPVATGVFGADMAVSLINNGPVTISLELD
jgi:D-tyrosyl-tRNA(Tyr) deacylase